MFLSPAGNWVEDRVHGNGEHIYANGNRYSGDWVDGKITGYGVLTFADGETYEGELKDGRMQGRGTVRAQLQPPTAHKGGTLPAF